MQMHVSVNGSFAAPNGAVFELDPDAVHDGLFADEATAMVETWSRSWFTTEGARVMVLVPRPLTDAILPLDVHPVPDELVRVLVGRLEYIPPEVEESVLSDLRALEDDTSRDAALRRLAAHDRFLEPHLHRALAISEDPVVQARARELIAALSPGEGS